MYFFPFSKQFSPGDCFIVGPYGIVPALLDIYQWFTYCGEASVFHLVKASLDSDTDPLSSCRLLLIWPDIVTYFFLQQDENSFVLHPLQLFSVFFWAFWSL